MIAYKIAAHAADIARKRPGARDRDDELSKARFNFDWEKQFELALDSETARKMHDETLPPNISRAPSSVRCVDPEFCSMQTNYRLDHVDEILAEMGEKPNTKNPAPPRAPGQAERDPRE